MMWLFIIFLFTFSYADKNFYKGYQLYFLIIYIFLFIYKYFNIRHELVRVLPKTNEHLRLIRHFEDNYGVKHLNLFEKKFFIFLYLRLIDGLKFFKLIEILK